MAQKIRINDKISYIEASENPLSADIGIVYDENRVWLFDVGNDERSLRDIETEGTNIVISHFHKDHLGSIDKIKENVLYVSKKSFEHSKRGTLVDKDIYIGNIHIFPIPSCHAQGCLGMEVDEEYAFVGDALYCKSDDKNQIYNAQLLKEEIEKLKAIKAKKLLVSHHKGMVREKDEAINELLEIYSKREKNNPFIYIPW